MTLYIRNFDEQIGRQLKAAAALRGVPLGVLLLEIIREWLEREAD